MSDSRYVVFWLDEKKVLSKFKECHDLTRQLERISCSLDTAERLLASPAPPADVIIKAIDDVKKSAEVVKTKHWVAEDRSAYHVERSAKDLVERIKKTKAIDQKTATKLRSTVQGLRTKASLLHGRVKDTCGLRTFEGIATPPKE